MKGYTIDKYGALSEKESKRVAALMSYQQMGTPAEEEFDNLTGLAALICNMPLAFISLIDHDTQWFKGRHGTSHTHTPRDLAFCNYTIMQEDVLEIPDTHLDDRFKSNPFVTGEPFLRYYAGIPLINPEGFVLGTFCVLDVKPGRLSAEQKKALEMLARQAGALMELKRSRLAITEAWERAEESRKSKEEFLANINHEIRTPLNGIIGMTGLLGHTPLSHEQKDYVDTIRSCGNTLMNVLGDILDFGKLESGQMELQMHNFSLREIIEEALDPLASQISQKNLSLSYHTDEDVPDYIFSDSVRLRQILTQLVSNAIKFTPAGEITVNISRSKDTGETGKIALQFAIKDSGIGIDQDKLRLIFKSFTQLESGNSRRYRGAGLGLALAQRLVSIMEGTIWAESDPGVGSSFYFTITAGIASEAQFSDTPEKMKLLMGKNLLVVDDDNTNLKVIRKQCENWGMVVHTAQNAVEGLGLLQLHHYQAVVLDMMMPELDGLDMAEHIKEDPRLSHVPVILYSSVGFFPERRAHLRAHFHTVLEKPLKYSLLRNTLIDIVSPKNHRPAGTLKPQPDENEKKMRARLRVLLAEDNPVNQRLLESLLTRMGYCCQSVTNGVDVVEAVKKETYHLILMDVQMPGMSGQEATRIILEMLPPEKVPAIIAITANAGLDEKTRCFSAGMDDYIVKPYKPEVIEDMMSRWGKALAERFSLTKDPAEA